MRTPDESKHAASVLTRPRLSTLPRAILAALLLILPCVSHQPLIQAQGLTSAAIEGKVVDLATNAPLRGVVVVALHEPSNSRYESMSRADGRFNLSGLRIGGPYTVNVQSADVRAVPRTNLHLALDEIATVHFAGTTDAVALAEMTVRAANDSLFGSGRIDPGSDFSHREIANIPSVRRNIQDIVRLDSRLTLTALDAGGWLSAQGQHPRYNSFLVDGVQAGDPFGLNGNGFSSLRSPVPPEAIEALSVSLAPYDVRRAGFTGALINAVTKSGTNELHGSVYHEFTNQNLRARNPVTDAKDVFDEQTWGLTLGGPLVRDRFFLFLSYDDFRRTAAPPTPNFVPDPFQLAQIVARAQALGYDPGTLDASNRSTQETLHAKLDWNITAGHHASFTFRRNDGIEPRILNFTGATRTSLSHHWFSQPRNTRAYTAQLSSQWSPALRTEVSLSHSRYDGTPRPNGAPFPEVSINGIRGFRRDTGATISNGTLLLGTPSLLQLNSLVSTISTCRFTAELATGDHLIAFGFDAERNRHEDKFVNGYGGVYEFAGADAWLAGSPVRWYLLSRPLPGHTIDDTIARWSLTMFGLYLQDTWRPAQRLTLSAGVRFDLPHVGGSRPSLNAAFLDAFGLRNDTTGDGNSSLSPRAGFSYEIASGRRTVVRGGLGLFQGRTPAFWLSDAYLNSGALGTIRTTPAGDFTFNPDPASQTLPPGSALDPGIFVIDPAFRQPLTWKANLAIDHELPSSGLILTAELTWLKDHSAVRMLSLNRLEATSGPRVLPDGRIRYAGGRRRHSGFADAFYFANTDAGRAATFTLSLQRPMRDNWGALFAYTHSSADDVEPMSASSGLNNYATRAITNLNEDVASDSNYLIDDRIVISLTRRLEFLKHAPTTISVVYEGRTGRPYSFVFRGDANGDGFVTNNDLLYVPTGPNDPKVAWASAAERDAFFAFVEASGLARYRGSIVPRNAGRAPWVGTIDVRLTQVIPLGRDGSTAEIYLSMLNLAHFIDSDHGLLAEVQGFRRAVASASFNPAGNGGLGQYNYTFNAGTRDSVPTIANDTPSSRWQIQAGIAVKF